MGDAWDTGRSPQTVWEVGRGIQKEVREWGSAKRPILALRRWQPTLTYRVGRVCGPTVPCTQGFKNHPDRNHNRQTKKRSAASPPALMYIFIHLVSWSSIIEQHHRPIASKCRNKDENSHEKKTDENQRNKMKHYDTAQEQNPNDSDSAC